MPLYSISEDIIQANICEEQVDAKLSEEIITINLAAAQEVVARLTEDVIQAQIIHEEIRVEVDCVCVASPEGMVRLEKEIMASMLTSSPFTLRMGVLPSSRAVLAVFVDVIEPFDQPIRFTVGSATNHHWLMDYDELDPQYPGTYQKSLDLEYEGTVEVFIYATFTDAPTTGRARFSVLVE